MTPPMVGSWRVRVRGARPFSIHGDAYHELHVEPLGDEPARVIGLRVAAHVLPAPVVGQCLELSFLMGQVTAARVIE